MVPIIYIAFACKDITLEVEAGRLVGIVGSIGSGKSAFLESLVGQLRKVGGYAAINGSIAYCPQQPWIQTGTVKSNILFESPLDPDRLEMVVKLAALEEDLHALSDGMDAGIGENGVNLSGGQKARVALARALYKDSDLYFFDDPIAALDAEVGRKVFYGAIKEGLKKKTVLFVTQQLHYLSEMDEILVFDNGSIVEQGSYKVLMDQNGVFTQMMRGYEAEDAKTVVEEKDIAVVKPDQPGNMESIVEEENRRKGNVKKSVYARYVEAMGPFWTTVYVTAFFFLLATMLATPLWMARWVADTTNATTFYLTIYTVLSCASAAALSNHF
jgi:ABC-type multidrug transport system ATPase subunit